MKKILAFIMTSLIVVSLVACSDKKDEATDPGSDASENTLSYKLIISCNEILENINHEQYGLKEEKKDIVPADGIVLEKDAICSEGSTAFDVVISELKKEKIHFDADDGYLNAIANLYAGDCGEFSGWMFFINGNLAEMGASDTVVSENDVVEFKYIVDYKTLF